MTPTDAIIGLVIAVGLIGIVLPILPGSALIWGAVLVWALLVGETLGWVVLAAVTLLLGLGAVVKYAVPGRRLAALGIPARTQWTGAAVAMIGFFVIPVVGLFLGFVLGVYVAERLRVGPETAWPSTVYALKAVGVSILIELAAAVLATGVWVAGVVVA